MNQDFGEWNAGEMKLIFQREWDCPFNWKVLVENFMESYHHLGAHSKTLQPTMPARDTWNEQEREAYIRCHLPVKESILEEWQELEAGGGYPYRVSCDPPTFREQEEGSGPFCGLSLFFIVCAGRSSDLVSGRTARSASDEIANYHFGAG